MTGQLLMSLTCLGSVLKSVGPFYEKLEAKNVLILSGAVVGSDFLSHLRPFLLFCVSCSDGVVGFL